MICTKIRFFYILTVCEKLNLRKHTPLFNIPKVYGEIEEGCIESEYAIR